MWAPLALALSGAVSGAPAVLLVEPAPELAPVGVARVDITPDFPVRLNGFGFRRAESEGVYQRIWAKALAFGGDDGDGPAVLLAVDSLGIRLTMVDEVAARLEGKAGVRRERVAVTFTHSHTTPKVNGAADTIFSSPVPPGHQSRIDRYTAELTDALERAALEALADRRPSHLGWSVGEVTFAKNRRTPGGPVDHSLPVLAVREGGPGGRVRAVYTTYACHCVTLSHNEVGGDWAGYAAAAIEAAFPGSVALVSIGFGSDANPDSGVTGDKVEVAAAQGGQVAAEVARILGREQRPVRAPLRAVLEKVDLPLRPPPSREALEKVARAGGPAGYSARWHLEKLDRGERLAEAVNYPVQTWTFGDDLALVFLAGEVCVDYALRLRREPAGGRLWLNGYANDFCAYIPSERLLREGGYGGGAEMVYFGLPTVFQPGLEQRIIDVVRGQLPAAFTVEGDPARTRGTRPLPPGCSLDAVAVPPGFRLELVAAEPLVEDPVAVDFGADGRLWVVEMRDYPGGLDGAGRPGGRVKVLADRDGDGRYDHASVFLDGLPFPTGVTAWAGGALVCAAPDIIYAQDTDGDGRADSREVLFSGFATHNFQARVNGISPGLDGWLYGACGLFGGVVKSAAGAAADLGAGRDFRLSPDLSRMEPAAGTSQQGRVRNDWGDWFGGNNGTLLMHYPLPERYVRRNPHFAPPPPAVRLAGGYKVRPAGEVQLFKLSGPSGGVTSACGPGIYRDRLLGAAFHGDAFACEPVHNAVVRLRLEPRGASYRAVPARAAGGEEGAEFLASTDRWFRPVQVRTGPGGGLWVVDMYRFVIEHPKWIPPEVVAGMDVRAGAGMGRIYRLVPEGVEARRDPPLAGLSPAGLAAALDSPNGPRRDRVQELLTAAVAGKGGAAGPEVLSALEKHARAADFPEVRAQAVAVLAGLDALGGETLVAALSDPHAGVRRVAARFSAGRLGRWAEVDPTFLQLADDPAAPVRLELAAAAGTWSDPRAGRALGKLLRREGDVHVRAVALASSPGHLVPISETLLSTEPGEGAGPDLPGGVLAALAATASRAEPAALPALLNAAVAPAPRFSPGRFALAAEVLGALGPVPVGDLVGLRRVVDRAREVVLDTGAPDDERVAAAALLGRWPGGGESDTERLAALLHASAPPPLQEAAVAALARRGGGGAAAAFLERWPQAGPELRPRLLEAVVSRAAWASSFLESVREDPGLSTSLGPAGRAAFLQHASPAVRNLAEEVLSAPRPDGNGNGHAALVARYLEGIDTIAGADPGRGAQVFRRACANCHRFAGEGSAVGPDLAALTDRSPAALVAAVLDPNRSLVPGFDAYALTTRDGRSATGVITAESGTAVTLIVVGGAPLTVLRKDIQSLRHTGASLMPEGLEAAISVPEMADLAAYLGRAAE